MPEQRRDPLDFAGQQRCPSRPEAQRRARGQSGFRNTLQPAVQRGIFAALDDRRRQCLDQLGGVRNIACRERVLHRARQKLVSLIPCAGSPMQIGDRAGRLMVQPRAQEGAEQVVVAVPAALVIQRHDEQIRVLDLLQDQAAVASRAKDEGRRTKARKSG